MKVLRKNIEMISWFEKDGTPHPIRFRIEDDHESKVTVKIHKILKTDKEKLAGNKMYVFTCQVLINGVIKVCSIKYELDTCKWVLFKI